MELFIKSSSKFKLFYILIYDNIQEILQNRKVKSPAKFLVKVNLKAVTVCVCYHDKRVASPQRLPSEGARWNGSVLTV